MVAILQIFTSFIDIHKSQRNIFLLVSCIGSNWLLKEKSGTTNLSRMAIILPYNLLRLPIGWMRIKPLAKIFWNQRSNHKVVMYYLCIYLSIHILTHPSSTHHSKFYFTVNSVVGGQLLMTIHGKKRYDFYLFHILKFYFSYWLKKYWTRIVSKFNIENKAYEKPPKKHTQKYLMGFSKTWLFKDSQVLSKELRSHRT